ncbi:MAG: nickel pincer cofactor biosynthesis protein LarC [Fibrobacterota bacterium]
MATLLFDIQSGISGDMSVAAALGLGIDEALFRAEMKKLGLDFEMETGEVKRQGIAARSFKVRYPEQHTHRHLHHILDIIDKSGLDAAVKKRATGIFSRLAEAEAKVHGTDIDHVHFHEVGAVDAIVDIVGFSLASVMLNVERAFVTPFVFGQGTVKCAHGVMAVPVPAVVELTRNFPSRRVELEGETVTPTGAAIATALAHPVAGLGTFVAERAGYGAGTQEFPDLPNVLRLLLGRTESGHAERVTELETHVDDASGELIGRAMERLFAAGALDAFTIPVSMKKNRPGVLVTVLCRPADATALSKVLLQETGSIGVRISEKERICLPRSSGSVDTPWGEAKVKIIDMFGENWQTPEYESCREIAEKNGLSVRAVYREVIARIQQQGKA